MNMLCHLALCVRKIGLQFVKRAEFLIVVELEYITKDEKSLAVTYVLCANTSVLDAFFFSISIDAGVPSFLLHYSSDFHRFSRTSILVHIGNLYLTSMVWARKKKWPIAG